MLLIHRFSTPFLTGPSLHFTSLHFTLPTINTLHGSGVIFSTRLLIRIDVVKSVCASFFLPCTYCMQISHFLNFSFLTAHTWGITYKLRRTTVCYVTRYNSSHLHSQQYSVAYSSRAVGDHVSHPHKKKSNFNNA